jgi:hypothetical protein
VTACVHIIHRQCGHPVGVAVPDDGASVKLILNEEVVEGLDEIRTASGLSAYEHRRHIVGWWHHFASARAMPPEFTAWCTGCRVTCPVGRDDIAGKVAAVRRRGKDRTLRV